MGSREQRPSPDDEDDASPAGPALHDDDAGRVTLSLDGPPLQLPEELAVHEVDVRHSSQPAPQFLDAWSADRVRRSSLPPSASVAGFSTLPPENDTEVPDDGSDSDLLALVGRARPAQAFDLVTEMTDRFALGDYSGALRAAQLLLGQDPEHELGQHYERESQQKLEELYSSRLRVRGGVLCLDRPVGDLAWLGLDPQVMALLSLIDGEAEYESLVARSGMPRLWALRALVELLDARVVRLV